MIRQCCVCKKIRLEDKWVAAGAVKLSGAEVTHGYCETCHDELNETLSKFAAAREQVSAVHAA